MWVLTAPLPRINRTQIGTGEPRREKSPSGVSPKRARTRTGSSVSAETRPAAARELRTPFPKPSLLFLFLLLRPRYAVCSSGPMWSYCFNELPITRRGRIVAKKRGNCSRGASKRFSDGSSRPRPPKENRHWDGYNAVMPTFAIF